MEALLLFGSGAVLGGISGAMFLAYGIVEGWRRDRDNMVTRIDEIAFKDDVA